jgi:hypothetical protein
MENVIDVILKNSRQTPVVIVQSDHGWRTGGKAVDHFSNLGAYLLPDGGERLLYPHFSNVNIFRVVLNHYFGAGLPLLEDRKFMRSSDRDQQFTEIRY